jgi:hypothetical protein
MSLPRPRSLPVFLLVKTAYQLLWRQRDDALRLGFVPTLIYFGGMVYGEDALTAFFAQIQPGMVGQAPPGVSLDILVTVLIAALAVALAVANWLRFMLLGPMSAVGLGLDIGRPHIAFLVWSFILLFAAGIIFSVISMPILLLPGLLASIGFVVVSIAVYVLLTRLSPFLVGQAIAQPMSIQRAWNVSRGNGMALATALIIVQAPLWIGLRLLSELLLAVGFASLAQNAMFFIGSVFQVASAILLSIVLATAFRHMVGIKV